MGLVGHQWAALRAGYAELADFLDLALALRNETDADVLIALRAPLDAVARSAGRTLGAPAESALRARIAASFAPALEALAAEPEPREPDETRRRRAALLGLVGEMGEQAGARGRALALVQRYLADRASVDPELADVATTVAAQTGDAALFDRYLAARKGAATPHESQRFLMALGEFREPALVGRALALNLTPEVGVQDVGLLLARLLRNGSAAPASWEFFKRRFPALRKKLPPALVARPIEAAAALATRPARRDIAAFFKQHPVPTAVRAVAKTLEQIDLSLAFDARVKPELAGWLAS